MSDETRTARSVVCDWINCPAVFPRSTAVHSDNCDRLTAAIEARDAQHAARLRASEATAERYRVALEFISTREGTVHPHGKHSDLCTHPACLARAALAAQVAPPPGGGEKGAP